MKRGEEKALSIGTPGDGGYLVPAETETEILRRLSAGSPIRAIASVRTVSSSSYKKPVTLSGPAVGWVAETDTRPQTNSQTIDLIDFPTAELYAMPAATSAFLDDAAVDVGQWIADEVNTAFAEQETAAFVTGNGTNKPKGFLSETQIAEASWAWDKIGYVATGVDGDFPAEDESDVLIDLVYTLKAGYRQNASWVMNRRTQSALPHRRQPRRPVRLARADAGGARHRGPQRAPRLARLPVRRGRIHGVSMLQDLLVTPLPASPARGEVLRRGCGNDAPHAQRDTLPLAGRVGEGGSAR